jgi:hypothetical protein
MHRIDDEIMCNLRYRKKSNALQTSQRNAAESGRNTIKRLSATLGVLILALIPDAWATSDVSSKIPEVPAGHPRVYVRPADIGAIRAFLQD